MIKGRIIESKNCPLGTLKIKIATAMQIVYYQTAHLIKMFLLERKIPAVNNNIKFGDHSILQCFANLKWMLWRISFF